MTAKTTAVVLLQVFVGDSLHKTESITRGSLTGETSATSTISDHNLVQNDQQSASYINKFYFSTGKEGKL